MIESFQAVANWIAAHPLLAYLAVFIIAMSESLVVIGLLVPGAMLLFVTGALVAAGALPFWPTMAWAVAGAVTGDGISFWLGYHYQQHLRLKWPFNRHADWLARGENFFHRHGSMSIALGRFVGPVRPIIPAIAGMLGMKPALFFTVNIVSALFWAPVYLLPGIAFGTSLALAGQVAARLALLLVILLSALWLSFWLARWLYRHLQPRASRLVARILYWGHHHPLLGRLTSALLDPDIPPPRALLVIATGLLGGAWLLGALLLNTPASQQALIRTDHGIQNLLSGLRTPLGDHIMVFFSGLADLTVTLWLMVLLAALFIMQRHWREIRYWLAASGFGATAIALLAWSREHQPENIVMIASTLMSMVIYGFLAVLLGRAAKSGWRWLPYACFALLTGMSTLARLYLGVLPFSTALSCISLGGAWICLLGIAYQRHPAQRQQSISGLLTMTVLTLSLTGGWHSLSSHQRDLQAYALHYPLRLLQESDWWQQAWRSFPAYRIDLQGEAEQPINLQWAGNSDGLRRQLVARGWHSPPPLTLTAALHWLQPDGKLADLPVLPQLHEGRHESLLLVRRIDENHQLALRLWPADTRLQPEGATLWLGTISIQKIRSLGLIRLPVTLNDFDVPLATLSADIRSLPHRLTRRHITIPATLNWQGTVLLLQQAN